MDCGGKSVQAAQHATHLSLDLSRRFAGGALGFQVLHPCAPSGHTWCTCLLVNETRGLTIEQPRSPAAQLAHLRFQTLVGRGLPVGVQALAIGLLQAFGRRAQPTDLVPAGRVRRVQAQRRMPTPALDAVPRHIPRPGTAGIRLTDLMGAPTIGLAALATDEHALEEVTTAWLGAPGAPSVRVPWGPLVCCHPALHWQEQLRFRRVPQGTMETDPLHPALRHVLEQSDLIGVRACEALGTMPGEAIHPARRGHIASALQAWSDE